jgi:4'-phosphopantetheinyl transferase
MHEPAWPGTLVTLSSEERAICNRFYFAEDGHDYANAHDLLRTALSQVAPVEPSQWRFERIGHGKPVILPSGADGRNGGDPPSFNLSHTRGLVACAIAQRIVVGVDIERTDRVQDVLELAERFFSPLEIATIRDRPDDAARALAFVELWTLKEAFIKAIGVGLSQPLSSMTFVLSGCDLIEFTAPAGFDPRIWHFALFEPIPRVRLAVAACHPAPPRFVARSIRRDTIIPIRLLRSTRSAT